MTQTLATWTRSEWFLTFLTIFFAALKTSACCQKSDVLFRFSGWYFDVQISHRLTLTCHYACSKLSGFLFLFLFSIDLYNIMHITTWRAYCLLADIYLFIYLIRQMAAYSKVFFYFVCVCGIRQKTIHTMNKSTCSRLIVSLKSLYP